MRPLEGATPFDNFLISLSQHVPRRLIHLPASACYEAQQSTYHTLQQSSLRPTCRITPLTSSHISSILQTAKEYDVHFAVSSGAQMSWKGASNIDGRNGRGGFTIDLSELNSVEFIAEEGIARLGPGAKWKDVYRALEPHNVTVVGGRYGEIGVSGFLLGGGISFLSHEHGFASSSILNYEIVLADGRVVNANAKENTELYWAMRLGSTNYGIVTCFDVKVHLLRTKEIWRGVQTYSISDDLVERANHLSQMQDILATFVSYVLSLEHDPRKLVALTMGSSPATPTNILRLTYTYLSPTLPNQLLLSDKQTSTPEPDSLPQKETPMSLTSLVNIVTENRGSGYVGMQKRGKWFTWTIKADSSQARSAKYLLDLYLHGDKLFRPVVQGTGDSSEVRLVDSAQWMLIGQPLSRCLAKASDSVSGDSHPYSTTLVNASSDLMLMVLITKWASSKDDKVMEALTLELGRWAQETARQREIFDPFMYLNYAGKDQGVYEHSLSAGSLTRMKKTKDMYDPEGVLDSLWEGGFKLVGSTI